MSEVTAVLLGARAATAAPGAAESVTLAELTGVRDVARAAGTELLWILDGRAVADQATLPALLEHASLPAASLPVDAAGAPVDALIGRVRRDSDAAVLAEVERRRVPLLHAPVVSLLVARREVASLEAPRADLGRYAGLDWTARLFAASGGGVLVPASRVRAPPGGPGDPIAALRMTRANAWSRADLARELRRMITA